MRKLFIFCILSYSISFSSKAQQTGVLNFISEKGDKFYVFLNDKKINETAIDNVQITDLPNLEYDAEIVFDNPSIVTISKKNIQIIDPDYKVMNVTYKITVNESGKGKLKFYSMYPVHKENDATPKAHTFSYSDEKQSPLQNVVMDKPKEVKALPQPIAVERIGPFIPEENKIVPSTPPEVKKNIVTPKGNGKKKNLLAESKCKSEWPMWQGDFSKAIKKIPELTSDQLKLASAKSVATVNCLSSAQVNELSLMLAGEESRLVFVKYAFLHTTDPGNYSSLEKLFSTVRSKDEFNKFISGD